VVCRFRCAFSGVLCDKFVLLGMVLKGFFGKVISVLINRLSLFRVGLICGSEVR